MIGTHQILLVFVTKEEMDEQGVFHMWGSAFRIWWGNLKEMDH
jgi:hypothetical protein